MTEIEFQRGLAGAEHVVGDAEARRDVVERVDAHGPFEGNRRRVEPRRQLGPVELRRAEARGAVVAQRALQRQPAARPAILDVRRRRRRAIRLVPLGQPERELIRHALVETVGDLRIGHEEPPVDDDVRALVTDLQVVRPGDVRRRRAPVVWIRVIGIRGGDSAIDEVRPRRILQPRRRIDRRRLLGHRDQIEDPVGRNLARRAAAEREIGEAGLEQQTACHRRAPHRLRYVVRRVAEIVGIRLGRHGRRACRDPVGASTVAAGGGRDLQRRSLAAALVLLVERDAMPAGQLRGEPPDVHRTPLLLPRRDARVGHPVPTRRVVGILVGNDALHGRRRVETAIAAEEPEPIAFDRAAIRDARVVRADDAGRLPEADGPQLVGQVVAARPVARVVDEPLAAERVPAGARHQVHRRPADVRLAEAARDGDGDLVDVDGIQDVGRDAAAVERCSHGHAVDLHAPFVDVAAARGEERHRRRGGERPVVDDQAGDGIQQGAD